MKKTKVMRRVLTILIPIFVLTSCVTLGDILGSGGLLISETSTTSVTSSSSEVVSPGENPYPLNGNLNNNDYVHPKTNNPGTTDNYYLVENTPYKNNAISRTKGLAHFESTGNQKMMVVPVKFTDTPLSYGSDDTIVAALNRAFFGESDETGWESVASFYNKSSYNKLNLTGEVMPVFNYGYSTAQLLAKEVDGYQYWDKSHYVVESVYNAYSAATLKSYDQDVDGYVDAVFFVYLAPVDDESEDILFWAFQFFWNRYENMEKPTFNVYAWASYEFMVDAPGYSYSKPAAHTYIHESGHLFGFDDYYDYDGTVSPAGGIDMMDHNIIDHNMFSKFTANWKMPYVPVGDSDILLRPAATTGDFIIINDNWNGTAYDEYILIEYYTPTGLNEHDSTSPTGYNGVKGYNISGVRIWHVDARLLRISNNQTTKYWSDKVLAPNLSAYYIDYATSNTPSMNNAHSSLRRLQLLDGQGRSQNWANNLWLANNTALFLQGATIGSNDWGRYLMKRATFNDGSVIGYSVEIGLMNAEGVTIKIRKA